MKPYSKLIRRIPPFRNLYRRIDALKKEDAALKKSLSAAQKEAEQQYKALEQRSEELMQQYKVLEQQCKALAQQDKALERQYKALEQRDKALEQQCKALEQQDKTLEQQCKELKKQIDANAKRCQEIAEQERKDCTSLRDEIAAVKKTAIERDRKDYFNLHKQQGDYNRELNRRMEYYYMKGLEPSRYPEALKEWYYHNTGHELNLEHPRTYNEKIQWLKLYDSTPLKGKLADKYEVRDYVREKIGEEYLVPLLGVWDRVEDIPFDELPEQYALKTTHGSGWNFIVQDKNRFDVNNAKRKLKKWIEMNFAFYTGLELHYRYIKPRIIAEKYIENMDGEVFDYRFFCFDGKVRSIWLDVDSGKPTHRRNVYTPDWKLIPLKVTWPNDSSLDKKPSNLEKMIEMAETLSQGFIHVRVDLYEIRNTIYFGEMTFTPVSGRCEWNPPEYDKIYGDMIHLPCDEEGISGEKEETTELKR